MLCRIYSLEPIRWDCGLEICSTASFLIIIVRIILRWHGDRSKCLSQKHFRALPVPAFLFLCIFLWLLKTWKIPCHSRLFSFRLLRHTKSSCNKLDLPQFYPSAPFWQVSVDCCLAFVLYTGLGTFLTYRYTQEIVGNSQLIVINGSNEPERILTVRQRCMRLKN
jgi:hypothetical protein